MVCVLLSVVFHSKIVHIEGEGNRTPFVGPKPGVSSLFWYPLPFRCFSNSCCARRPACGRPLGGKVVLLQEVVGGVCEFETHVLKAGHWGV